MVTRVGHTDSEIPKYFYNSFAAQNRKLCGTINHTTQSETSVRLSLRHNTASQRNGLLMLVQPTTIYSQRISGICVTTTRNYFSKLHARDERDYKMSHILNIRTINTKWYSNNACYIRLLHTYI